MNFYKLLFIFIVSSFFVKCTVDHEEVKETFVEQQRQQSTKILSIPKYSKTELIIKFKNDVSDLEKNKARKQYAVVSYEYCDLCTDLLIEKWNFGEDANIEDKKLSIQSGSGGPEGIITNVDNEFTFHLENENNTNLSVEGLYDYSSQIVGTNSGVTLAVLDTGIDANYPLFDVPFLYSSDGVSVSGETSGWDFVNHDNDFFDDFNLIHGTKVSYIINKKLKEAAIPHQILPVKVCDANGIATYFDILCGLNYALPRVHIIQMSLGWYDDNSYVNSIFNDLVDEFSNVLIVTSAGNSAVNNDVVSHYPSSYPQVNILAIAAANTDLSDIADFSNYGINNVDFYAPGEEILFYDLVGIPLPISGTSYAAPLVAAKAAKILYDSGMTHSTDQIIDDLNTIGTDQTYSKSVKYSKLLN